MDCNAIWKHALTFDSCGLRVDDERFDLFMICALDSELSVIYHNIFLQI